VTTRDELEALSSRELHDLAVRRALRHVDVEFLWELLRALPAAEASEGHPAHAGMDITKVSSLIADAVDSGEGEIAEALRPLYIDYLIKHGTD
jgi:transposase